MDYPFTRRLAQGPILCDGAMGTLLLTHGVPTARPFDELNLTNRALIDSIHRDYIAAGAEVIETNTFGANHARLAPYGLEGRVREINLQGVKIARNAREVSGEDVLVAGAIGPLGLPAMRVREMGAEEVRAIFREQVEGLLEGGADLLILETFGDAEELAYAVESARSVCDLPVVAQLTFDEDGSTLAGQSVAEAVGRLCTLGIQAIGTNCNLGPQATLDAITAIAALGTGLPLSAQPNAGLPARVEGRFIYGAGPDYFADYARRFADAGVALIGGCCGTTPAHIRAMRLALGERPSPLHPSPPDPLSLTGRGGDTAAAKPVPASHIHVGVLPSPAAGRAGWAARSADRGDQSEAQRRAGGEGGSNKAEGPAPTHLQQLLAEGRFVVSVEMRPPRGVNPAKALRGAAMLRDEGGVDVVNIPDNAMARVRMGALPLAYLIRQQLGLDVIVHMTGRDRNLMALQSEMLGAHAHDVRNVLALYGDPVKAGDYPNVSGIWDVDAVGLIEVLARLNRGEDSGGAPIGRRAGFFIGCAVDPVKDWAFVRERLQQKLDAGAQFIMSQPIFDVELFHRFMDHLGPLPVPFLVGVAPLNSYRHAEYLHNEVPGMDVPEAMRERMARAGENGQAEGIAMARDFLAGVVDRVQGAYIFPSFDRYEVATEVVRGLPGR